MKNSQIMNCMLQIVTTSERCTKKDLYASCIAHQVVRNRSEFDEALSKLLKKGRVTLMEETDEILFRKPCSYLRQPGSIKLNGTTDRLFFDPLGQPLYYTF